jgi:hypothetical protein
MALDFGRPCGHCAGYENRDLHFLQHYYPLGITGGAAFFIL